MRHDGTIAVVSGEAHVWPSFSTSLAALAQAHPRAKFVMKLGTNIAQGRNQCLREMAGDWLWFIDTDMVFPPDTLERLLNCQRDIVQGLVLLRHPPHFPVVYRLGEDGGLKQAVLNRQPPGLIEVDAVGTGGTLIRRRVRDSVADPWFEVGTIKGDELGEDLCFSSKARKAGFKMWVDLRVPIGHLTPTAIWPHYTTDAGWLTAYKLTTGEALFRAAASATDAEPAPQAAPKALP